METVLFIFGVVCLLIILICVIMIIYHTITIFGAKRWTPRMKNPPPPPSKEKWDDGPIDTGPNPPPRKAQIETSATIIARYDKIISDLEKRVHEPFEGINPICIEIHYYKELKEEYEQSLKT